LAQTPKTLNIALWILQLLAAAMFLFAGGSKLAGQSMMVQTFAVIGVGQWFRYVTGVIEVGSALLLLTPRFAAVGAFLLCCTMIGATIAHLTVLHESPLIPLVLLVVCAIIVWGRARALFS
jgi:putative oxidoreductase